MLLYDQKRWRIVANADNSHQKQKKWFGKSYLIMYLTWSRSVLFIIYYFIYLFITVSKYSKASSKTKKSVNDWRNWFKNKKYLHSPGFHIHKLFAQRAIWTSKCKNILEIFFTKSLGHDWLIDIFCMLARDALVSYKFSPIKWSI